MTRDEFESALDGHLLWVKENWSNGPRWYLVRRNGKTRTWVRDKNKWKTPIKWKLRECFTIGSDNIERMEQYFRVGREKPTHKIEGTQANFDRYVAGDR